MRRPSLPAVAIGLIPFIGMCLTVPWWDRVTPMIFGLPFNLFWLVLWIILTSGCMALANRVEERGRKKGTTTV
ncbi:DUF3311 domain-containing protein [Edaphobacter modestus]|uniref:Uncharacterized protein DUF3311 n=1 Tax=Edaphobacter modestus TaxID=388466 RepID=A0A4Q7YXQ5_9BACT|nr:DUF3311 domain-containing protein [Edaphobacter modestus]RZU42518.1 uncharacterized protein DUF3311 [Edaphobacter modestus]